VLVAVYRVRGQGGNEFVGQATFDLGDLARNGTTEARPGGVDARSLTGSFPLIDRLEKWVGNYAEISVDLEMAWRPDTVLLQSAPAPPAPPGQARPLTAGGGMAAAGGRGVAGRGGDASVAAKSSALRSKPPLAPPSKAPAASARLQPGQARIVSNNLRRQNEERRRIELANKVRAGEVSCSCPCAPSPPAVLPCVG